MAKEKAKPKSSKAKPKDEPNFSEEEIEDYSEVDEEFSENEIEKKPEGNFFGKAYKWLEEKYFAFSDWLSEKGIGLNKLNDKLEEKGIPAFAFVTCLTIIILVLLLMLIINFATKTTVEFSITDYSGNKLQDVQVSITDLKNKTKFTETISDGYKKRLSLASGKDYYVSATKSDFNDYYEQITFDRKDPIAIKFDEKIVSGTLILTVTDSETLKAIEDYNAKLNFRINNLPQEILGTPNNLGQIIFSNVPQGKDLTLTLEKDGYQTITQAVQISGSEESLTVPMIYDQATAELQGKEARLVILAQTESGDVLDDCNVTVYDMAGEIIDSGITQVGKVTFTVKSGIAFRFVVTKEGYRIYDSNDQNRTFRLTKSEESFIAKMIAGSSNLKVNIREDIVGPVEGANVSLYSMSGNILQEETTLLDGQVTFVGLDKNTDYVVTACKEEYLCAQYITNIDAKNDLEITMVRGGTPDVFKLSVYVYDEFNNPVTSAKVLVYKKINSTYIPIGLGPIQVDLLGIAEVYTKASETYKAEAIVGDVSESQEITIDPLKENKIIIMVEEASRKISLTLTDIHGNPVIDGCVIIKSKSDDILAEACILEDVPIEFQTKGYKDIIIDYTDLNGDTTTVSTIIGTSDDLVVALKPSIVDSNPIISFVELRDSYNNLTTVLSKDTDYYLVFDVLFPVDAQSCGAHFRVGEDSENDSDGMYYGITGFKADTTSFKYSTTYNAGQQNIDVDNVGAPNQLNKWLELYWSSETLTNKQVMLKVKANEVGTIPIKYRSWCNYDGQVYRDPTDSILNNAKNVSSRQALYADTKELTLKVLETAAECSNNICIEYRFLDKDGFDYSKESFFAVKEDMYLLELSYYSVLNGELSIEAETDSAHPIIGLINYQDTEILPETNLDSQETKASSFVYSLESGNNKKQYLLFNARDTGVTYIDVKSKFNSLITEKRLSFEIKQRRNLLVTVPEIFAYNSSINVTVQDADNQTTINNALVKLTDDFGEILSSTKTGRNGKYIINQNFSSSRPTLEVTAPGYIPYKKQIIIADKGIIYGPDTIEMVFGNEITQESQKITLVNKGNIQITDLSYNITEIDAVTGLTTETQLPIVLDPNKPEEIEIFSTIDQNINFKIGKSILTIYGFIGNKQVAKVIEIIYYKGQVKEDCLDIKPQEVFAYVGISEGSENEIQLSVVNNCKKQLIITPELLKAKGTTIKKDENLEVYLPTIIIEPNEEITDYTITIKNNKARTTTKSFKFEIAWRNSYYALPYTKLNVDIVDQSKTIMVTPPVSVISLSQVVDERGASNKTVFSITNTGKYPLKDIQISRLNEALPSNIQDKIEPMSFTEIKPGQTKQVYIQYEGKVDKSSFATLYYKVSANSKGSKEPVETKFTVGFRFSSAACLKIDQKKVFIYTKVGEEKVKLINITNYCADPINFITHDLDYRLFPSAQNMYNLAFGDGTQVSLTPATPIGSIAMGQTVPFYLKIKPTKYFEPKIDNRVTIVGFPSTNTALSMVSAEMMLFSIEVEPENADQKEDIKRVNEASEIKICGEDEKTELTMPKIVISCKDEGYCDGEGAAQFIAEKVQEMHNQVMDAVKQANNEIGKTNCSPTTSSINGCPISEILNTDQMADFRNIPIYVMNDNVTDRTVELVIKNEKAVATKYPTIKDYQIRTFVGYSTAGLQTIGNIIHVDDKIHGCGRYKITIDGAIATKDQATLYPERAYFFVTIDANTTEVCKKSIENVRLYLPKDTTFFSKSNTGSTWLTMISGDERFGKPVSKGVFNTEDRFQLRTDEQKKFSQLDITTGPIPDNNKAIAKIYFNNLNIPSSPQPEKVNVIINNRFGSKATNDAEDFNYSKEFIEQVSGDVKKIIDGIPADICIAKDKSYMLILSFDKDFGMLSLKPQTDKLQLTPLEKCTTAKIKSAISEEIKIKAEKISGVTTRFDYQGQNYPEELSIFVDKDKEVDFNICFLANISQVSNWSNKQLKITANSRFTVPGKAYAERHADANITLLNYGITPVDLLGITQTTSESLGKDSTITEKSFYAYVDWDKAYNKNNSQPYCEALEKYNKGLGDKSTIFRKPESCDFSESKSEVNARNSRALKRSGEYFTGCFGTCALITGGKDAIPALIPILGQANMTKDILLNCGLGCGFPAGGMYLEESKTEIPAFTWIGKVMGAAIGPVADLIGKIFNPSNLGVLGPTAVEVFKTRSATNIDLPDVVTNPTYTDNLTYTATSKINVVNGIQSQMKPGLVGAELRNFEGQLLTNHEAIKRGLGIGGPYSGSAAIFNPATTDATDLRNIFTKASDGTTLNLTKLNSGELQKLDDILNRGVYSNYPTTYQSRFLQRFSKYRSGSSVNLMPTSVADDFLKNSDETLKALNAHSTALAGSTDPGAVVMKQNVDDAILDITDVQTKIKGATPVSGGYQIDDVLKTQIDDISKTNSLVNRNIDDVDNFLKSKKIPTNTSVVKRTLTDADLSKRIKTYEKLKLEQERQMKNLTANEKSINSKGTIRKTTKLNKVNADIADLKSQMAQTDDALQSLKGVQKKVIPKGGVYELPDDVMKKLDTLEVQSKNFAKIGASKWTRRLQSVGNFAVDWAIVLASNRAGKFALDELSETGQYNNLLYLDDSVNFNQFDKGTWYKVTVIKQTNKFDLRIEKEEPSTSGETIIKYKEDKEIKEILTSEHTDELLGSSTPQKPAEEVKPSDKKEAEAESGLQGLQVQMYSEKSGDLKEYTSCKFNGPTSCLNIDTDNSGNLNLLSANYCSAFVQRVARENYGMYYSAGNACDSSTVNFGTRNKVIWQRGVDDISKLDDVLVPGVAITIERPSNTLSCQPTHVILYTGKNNDTDMILHQFGATVYDEPMASRFTTNQIYQVVIPSSGYALYDSYAPKVA